MIWMSNCLHATAVLQGHKPAGAVSTQRRRDVRYYETWQAAYACMQGEENKKDTFIWDLST